MTEKTTTIDKIREAIRSHARLSIDIGELPDGADLYQAGMTSHASVNLMLALEDTFDLEFPDHLLKRSAFESVTAIEAAVSEIQAELAA